MRMFDASIRFMILTDFPKCHEITIAIGWSVCAVVFAVNTELICLKCQFEIKAFTNKRFGW